VGARHPRSAASIGGLGFAFLLLTWPLIWLAVACARWLITGETIGS
jgi:hypothetical protein